MLSVCTTSVRFKWRRFLMGLWLHKMKPVINFNLFIILELLSNQEFLWLLYTCIWVHVWMFVSFVFLIMRWASEAFSKLHLLHIDYGKHQFYWKGILQPLKKLYLERPICGSLLFVILEIKYAQNPEGHSILISLQTLKFKQIGSADTVPKEMCM